MAAGLPPLTIIANRRRPGIISRKSSRRLPARSGIWADRPVTLPPGRARPATRLLPTGSATAANKFGDDLGRTFEACLCPAILDRDIATFDPAKLAQTPLKGGGPLTLGGRCIRTQKPDGRQPRRLLRTRRERPRGRRPAEQRDERAALHVDFALPLIASPSSACHPALLIFTRATSVILPSVAMRSACADASPARTSSAVNPFANISASVQPSGDAASSSRARRRSGLGPRRRR